MMDYPTVFRDSSPNTETQTVVYLCRIAEPLDEEMSWLWRQGASDGWRPFSESRNFEMVFGYWTDSTKFGLCWEEAAGL